MIAFQLLILVLSVASASIIPKDVLATASYKISISVNPTSGRKGTSFTVTASVSISNMKTGTAHVILKTVAPDGTYSYYASSAQDVTPYRQWVPSDMPVSQTYTWTVKADQVGDYVSIIEITIDGDVPNGFLKDSRSVTFTSTASSSNSDGTNYYYYVSVQEDSVLAGNKIHISVNTDYPNPSFITVRLRDSSGKTRASWAGDSVPSTYTIPSSGPDGTWVISPSSTEGVDTRGDSFKVTGSDSPSQDQDWIRLRIGASKVYVGQSVTLSSKYKYTGTETIRIRYLANLGSEQVELLVNNPKYGTSKQFKPPSPGIWTVRAYLEEKRWNPTVGYYWSTIASDAKELTVNAKMVTSLVLEFPKKVHVGDTIRIVARLICNKTQISGKIRLFVDQGEHIVESGEAISLQATSTGTIDVSACYDGDEAHEPSKNGGGLIEVWTKPTIKVEKVSIKS
ncbi:MAG: hypothetical protein DRO00_10000 [Thermoproteota archaeon]|nr:MAG: hypothetical protein DRO00_10000 [Candidatus Korarchaeota archaeon]